MKSLNKKSTVVRVLFALVLALALIIPAQLPAVDIDDAIGGLEQDFSFGGKEEIKRGNLDTANEQNREDIKIEEGVAAGQLLTITYSAMVTSHIRTNFISVLGQQININEAEVVTGMGTETATFLFPSANLQAGLTFPLFVSVTCLTGNCEVSASLSGVINGVNINCTTISTGMFMAPNTVLAGPSTCTTS